MEENANKINEEIKKSVVYKEYIYYKDCVKKSEYLMSLKVELDDLKKRICVNKDEKLLNEYYDKEKQYKNDLLIQEYINSKEQLNDLLKDIVDILSLN